MPVEPPAGPVDVVVAEQNVAAPAVPGRPAPVGAHAPGEVTAGHARGDGQHQVEVRTGHRARGQGAGEQHGQLRWHRDAGRLRQHQHEDRQIPVVADELLHRWPGSFRLAKTARYPGQAGPNEACAHQCTPLPSSLTVQNEGAGPARPPRRTRAVRRRPGRPARPRTRRWRRRSPVPRGAEDDARGRPATRRGRRAARRRADGLPGPG